MPVQEVSQRPSVQQEQSSGSNAQAYSGIRTKGLRPIPGGQTARFLGWFSIGLGLAEILFPKKLARMIGAPPHPARTRMMGLREVVMGAGILGTPRPSKWLKARVAGDAADLAFLKSSFSAEGSNKTRLTCATAAVAAITVVDAASARKSACAEPEAGRIRIESSRAVNRSPEECYDFWRNVENLPRFMSHVESVRKTGENTAHWRLKPVSMKSLEWNSRITDDVRGETISWQSEGGDVESFGTVRFEPLLPGQGTNIRVSLEYAPPLADPQGITGRVLKTISESKLREDLRRFKSLIETGEIPTTEGQPSGREMNGRDSDKRRRARR